jgi:hypothetical protein
MFTAQVVPHVCEPRSSVAWRLLRQGVHAFGLELLASFNVFSYQNVTRRSNLALTHFLMKFKRPARVGFTMDST